MSLRVGFEVFKVHIIPSWLSLCQLLLQHVSSQLLTVLVGSLHADIFPDIVLLEQPSETLT